MTKPELPPNASSILIPRPAQRAASRRDQAEAATESFVHFDAVAGAVRRIGAVRGLTKPELPPTTSSILLPTLAQCAATERAVAGAVRRSGA